MSTFSSPPSPFSFQPSGIHVLADLHGIASEYLSTSENIQLILLQAAQAAGAHILFSHFHSFGPGEGITGVVILAESHISIHTWPEFEFAAIDIFMCGSTQPEQALAFIQSAFQPKSCIVHTLSRGYTPSRISGV